GEGVTGHKKPKKHHRRNKQPVWFKEFVDNVFLPTIARIEARLDKIEARLDAVENDISNIKNCLKRNNIV
ncbi:MAG: hypothetical protein LBH55_00175, partial [Mycoplasmataceae bacterium]|nr:hypothetical protein [Mycoplasmataceae bacterium]